MNTNILTITAIIAVMLIPAGHAEHALFTAQLETGSVTASSELRYAQDTPYVSLSEIMEDLGGVVSIQPDQVQTNWRNTTAVVNINDYAVNVPGVSFTLVHPARVHDASAFIARADVGEFFLRAFDIRLVPVDERQQTVQLTPVVPEAPDLDNDDADRLLESLELPPMASETIEGEVVPESEEPEVLLAVIEETDDVLLVDEGIEDVDFDDNAFAETQGTVVLDPAHGGQDTGIVINDDRTEKDLTLDIALRTRRILKESTGITIAMTRETDNTLSLSDRAAIVNRMDSDLLVSIHAGYSTSPKARGIAAFTDLVLDPGNAIVTEETRHAQALRHDNAEKAGRYAYRMSQVFVNEQGTESVRVRTVPLFMQGLAHTPCILIETAYLSNPDVIAALDEDMFLEETARLLAMAITGALQHE